MLLAGQFLGDYKVIKPLGAGGFGAVFLAEDQRLQRQVALKVPHKQGAEGDEMLKETRLMARLNHPHVVRLYKDEHVNDIYFLVLEFVDGGSLHDYITDRGRLDEETAIDFAIQVLEGLDYAHDQNILHRDVRPSNVLVALSSGKPFLKLTDFGTSRYLNTNSAAATRVGSPPYMAPEHFEARAVFASDVYSVGVMLYEMVTGELPVFDINPVKIYEMIMQGKPQAVHLRNPAVSREFSALTSRAMAPRLSDRHQNARELLRDLEALRRKRALPASRLAAEESRERIAAAPYQSEMPRRTPVESPRVEPTRQKSRTCWKCHKLVPVAAVKCPACGEKL